MSAAAPSLLRSSLRGESIDSRLAKSIRVLPNGCWHWLGKLTAEGYGRFSVGRSRYRLAHRFVYERYRGKIPDNMGLDHICHDPKICHGGKTCPHRACVNPEHTVPATQKQNNNRARSVGSGTIPPPRIGTIAAALAKAAKPYCINGHAFTPENTNFRRGARTCRACDRIRALKAYHAVPATVRSERRKAWRQARKLAGLKYT